MEYKDFIVIIKNRNTAPNKFKKYSTKELCIIMGFIEQKLKSKSGNWGVRNIDMLAKELQADTYDIYYNLLEFYEQYSKRKKTVKMFKSLLDKYKDKLSKNYKESFKKRYGELELSLKDKRKIGEFLEKLRNIKKEYINGLDDDFLKVIHKNIKTGYKQSTLRNYYYNY